MMLQANTGTIECGKRLEIRLNIKISLHDLPVFVVIASVVVFGAVVAVATSVIVIPVSFVVVAVVYPEVRG